MAVLLRDAQLNLRRALRMNHNILHQVNQHLLDERRIHRHHQQLIRHADPNRNRVEPLFKLADRLRRDFFRRLRNLANLHRLFIEPRDGEHVLHQPHQPLRVVTHMADEVLLHLVAEFIVVFQNSRR